jgi:hypothetical protein
MAGQMLCVTPIADSHSPIEQADVDRDMMLLRAQLGSVTCAVVWNTGQQMSLEQAA